jgi:hypothetical protein
MTTPLSANTHLNAHTAGKQRHTTDGTAGEAEEDGAAYRQLAPRHRSQLASTRRIFAPEMIVVGFVAAQPAEVRRTRLALYEIAADLFQHCRLTHRTSTCIIKQPCIVCYFVLYTNTTIMKGRNKQTSATSKNLYVLNENCKLQMPHVDYDIVHMLFYDIFYIT